MAARRFDRVAMFWSRVTKSDGCWLWTGARIAIGYGKLRWHNRTVLAHRQSYELHSGAIPSGMQVLHRCDQPLCVRPDHLFLGTMADNMADKNAKRRGLGQANQPHAWRLVGKSYRHVGDGG